MVLAVSATEYLGRSESGRSKPMMCRCEDADGNEYSVYVKYSDFHEELTKPHLTAELIGNCLARDLDIPAAQPCIVSVSEEFIDTIEYDDATFEIHEAFVFAP